MATVKTISYHDTLVYCSTFETVYEMLDKMLSVDGEIYEKYDYVYTLFKTYNSIRHGGAPLSTKLDNIQASKIVGHYDDALYHMDVAVGLAAGIITAPGVSVETKHANDAVAKAKTDILYLQDNIMAMVDDDDSRAYVQALQTASDDKSINVEVLITTLIWNVINDIDDKDAKKEDMTNKFLEIHIKIQELKKNSWKDIFKLKGLTINYEDPGSGDDWLIVNTTIQLVGMTLGVSMITIQVYLWKKYDRGIFPKAKNMFGKIAKSFKSKWSDAELSEYEELNAEMAETEVVEMSTAEIVSGVLAVVGVLLIFISTILQIEQLEESRDKIKDAKTDFQDAYKKMKSQMVSAIQLSENFRPKPTSSS